MSKPLPVLKTALPVMFGYFPVAVTFGLLANQQRVGIDMALALSALVFAGASQFVGLTLLANQDTGFAAVFVTVGLINLRHFILSLAYIPHVRDWSIGQKLRFFPFLTDETFAVLIGSSQHRSAPDDAWRVALLNYATWITGTVIGFYSGELVPNPKTFGLDFALPALFIGIVVLFVKKRSHIVTLVMTVLLSLLFFGFLDMGRNSVLLAALIASSIGWYIGRREVMA